MVSRQAVSTVFSIFISDGFIRMYAHPKLRSTCTGIGVRAQAVLWSRGKPSSSPLGCPQYAGASALAYNLACSEDTGLCRSLKSPWFTIWRPSCFLKTPITPRHTPIACTLGYKPRTRGAQGRLHMSLYLVLHHPFYPCSLTVSQCLRQYS